MSLEIFKDIKGNENYQITSWGRVFSKQKKDFVTPEKNEKGYLRVRLFDGKGGWKRYKVHRLVANAFIPNYDMKPQVNHIDGNKLNNSITNLEWVTNDENVEKARILRAIQRGVGEEP